ncbi:hypothetical protein DGG96_01160 [Legionella qingyii]|uniref:Uncharacterized protein n=1 Tax=Legionella qingyii TaxID=2184757 RepID=A0A317U8Z0_9GAMM|nr:hypothetical protein [Legionella qingyii]PWY57022.1 hypothetical protein DGG96_03265 [Legionella qingyii]PWY57357.1 hypothetical protein DGG96_01160 [Legionella qingyii]RUR26446.1 hypothetical protein ELY20_00565 [Legionella qingyii]
MPRIVQQIPKLATLAAKEIEKSNPHLFFTLYKNTTLPLDLENQYINPLVQDLVNKHGKIYLANIKKRKKLIDERSSAIEEDCCYKKAITLAMVALGTGVHFGIYFILRASGVPHSTTLTFLATIPVTVIVMGCFSPCASILLSKLIARGTVPDIPSEVVDLTEVVEDIESQKNKSHLTV